MWMVVVTTLAAAGADATPALTLDAALDEAASQNLDLQLAQNAHERAEAGVLGSYGGFLPRLDVSATFGRDFVGSQRQVRVVPVLDPTTGEITYDQQPVWTPAREFEDYTVSASVEQSLFDGLRSSGQMSQARAERRAAVHQVSEAALAVSFLVTQRFYEVVKAEQSLTVLEETVQQSRDLVARADALYAAGRLPRGDTLTTRVNLGNDQINVETQRARLEQARAELAAALGRDGDPELRVEVPADLVAPRFDRAGEELPAFQQLVTKAKEARPAIARESERIRSAEYGQRIARAGYLPAVGLSVTYARQGPELTGDTGVYGRLDRQYVAGAQVYARWNLFAGLGTLAATDSAAADLERARLTASQVSQQITTELATARAAAVALGRAARIADENLASAEAAVRLARERFDAGAATQLEVRDAQLKLTQARLAVVSTRSDYAIAFADLNRAVGGGL